MNCDLAEMSKYQHRLEDQGWATGRNKSAVAWVSEGYLQLKRWSHLNASGSGWTTMARSGGRVLQTLHSGREVE